MNLSPYPYIDIGLIQLNSILQTVVQSEQQLR